MTMTASEARELSNKNGFEIQLQKKIQSIERSIKRACENGKTSTCVFPFYSDYEKSDVDLKAKEYFKKLGYTFKRTGMNGGVPQTTEDICW